jgi:hypothetical protein
MKNIIELGKYSFELEEKREQSLLEQAGQMLTAFSVTTAALFMVIPIVTDASDVSKEKLLFCVGIVSFVLLVSLILALFAQWRFKYDIMSDVDSFYKSVFEEPEKYITQEQFDMQWKFQLKAIHDSKKKNNDKRSRLIITSMILFICSIALTVIFTLLLTIFTI